MKIKFVDHNRSVLRALQVAFEGVPDIEYTFRDIKYETGDALVSPANSFGWMDGGVDAAYLQMFGYQLQVRVQSAIAEKSDGFLPVGQALTVHTMGFGLHLPRFLIVAPTMEIPRPVPDTQNAYYAFRAALYEAQKRKEIQTLICPGMCSLTGHMPPEVMAKQMRKAYDEVMGYGKG